MNHPTSFEPLAHGTRATLLLVATLLLAPAPLLGVGQNQMVSCDPHKTDINAAIALRNEGRFKEARERLEAVAKRDPGDFRTNFILATVLLQSEPSPSIGDVGMTMLRKAETLLPSQPATCNDRYGWYSIYNTLGSQYYLRHDDGKAEYYLGLAYRHIDHLYPSTKQNMLVNFGILRFHQNRIDDALKYYDAATEAGSKTGAQYARVIRKIQRTKLPTAS